MDLGCVLISLPVLLPLLFSIAFVLSFRRGPILFSQIRVGKNSQLFRIWKFRSMAVGAENQLLGHLRADTAAALEWSISRKLRRDPRVTKFGSFLRRTSLDELPQIWNILQGDMSLVGPRPVPRDELDKEYQNHKYAYHSCRPGLTGLWQVSGRHHLSYAKRVQLDCRYAANQSTMGDITILLRTVRIIWECDGC